MCFRRPKRARHTYANGCSFRPTPDASVANDSEGTESKVQESEWKPAQTQQAVAYHATTPLPDVRQEAVEVMAEAVHYRAQLDEEDEILGKPAIIELSEDDKRQERISRLSRRVWPEPEE